MPKAKAPKAKAKAIVKAKPLSAPDATKEVGLQLGCHVTLFKTALHAIYDHQGENEIFLIYEPDAGETATGITLSQIGEQVMSMIETVTGKKGSITVNLPPQIQKFADNLEIYIRQVFLKARRLNGKPWSLDDYALWISIETTAALKKELNLPFTIDKVFLKLWKTDNEYIKSTMNISQVEKLIPSAS